MKKIILGLLLATSLSTASFAATTAAAPAIAPAPVALAKTDFESLSKAEKIKLIEQKHAAAKVKADAKWKAMSDDEKITKYEHRRQAFMARRNGAATAANTAPTTVAPSAAVPTPAPAAIPIKK